MSKRSGRKLKSTRKQSRIASFMIVASIIFVCAVIILKISDLRKQSLELAETEKILEYQIEQAKNEKETLAAKEQYMKTNQYIEEVAKDKFGLVYPDEIVIKPLE